MNQLANLILLDATLFLITFFSFKKKGGVTVCTFVFALYTFVGFCSINFYLAPGFKGSTHDGNISTESVLYFLFVLLLFLSPLFKLKGKYRYLLVDLSKFKYIYISVYFCCVIVFIYTFLTNSLSIDALLSNFSDIRDDVGYYRDFSKQTLVDSIITGWVSSLMFFSITISMFSLFVLKYKKKLSLILFIVTIAYYVLRSLLAAGRANIVFLLFSIVYNYLLMKCFFDFRQRKYFNSILILISVLVCIYVLYANVARFGDSDFGESYFLWKYSGESFVNFTGILYPDIAGYTDGVSSFGFFRRILGLDYYVSMSDLRTYVENITHTPSKIFYTFIGNIFRDFGPLLTALIAVILSVVLRKCVDNNDSNKIEFRVILLMGFLGQIYLPGLFYFSLYSQTGNIAIILMIIAFIYLKRNTKSEFVIDAYERK